MGSKLTGGDIKVAPEDTAKLAAEVRKWKDGGKQAAAQLFAELVKETGAVAAARARL